MDGCLGFWTDPNFSFEAGSVNVDGIYYGSVQEYLKTTRSDGSAGIGPLRLTTPLATVAAERVAIRCKRPSPKPLPDHPRKGGGWNSQTFIESSLLGGLGRGRKGERTGGCEIAHLSFFVISGLPIPPQKIGASTQMNAPIL